MAKRDHDLDRYLDKVSKSPSRFVNLSDVSRKKSKEEIVVVKEKTPFQHFISNLFGMGSKRQRKEDLKDEDIEEPEETVVVVEDKVEEQVEEDAPKKKKSFFSRLFSFGGDSDDEVSSLDEEEVWKEDMRTIALFTKELLKKVPVSELKKMKEEGKLEEFKTILKRNGLLKE